MDFLQSCWILCMILNLMNWSIIFGQNCPNIKLLNGSVRLKGKGRLVDFRCKRNYELVGVKFAVCLSTGQWSQQTPTCVGTTCVEPPGKANVMVETLFKGGVLKFTCGAGLIRSGPETLMCDGNKWSDEPPKCIEGVNMGCDFEHEDLCGWSHDNTDDFDWTWNKGETPTANTGPPADHTTNSSEGHYLFMESSAPQKIGQKTRIISPPYVPEKMRNMCLEFFYHMFGPDGAGEVGDLDVYVRPQRLKTAMLTATKGIFHRSGNQGDKWIGAEVEIPSQTGPFNIVFQATRLKSWTGDIAIDDLKLYKCPEKISTTNAPTVADNNNDDSEDLSDDPSDDSPSARKTTTRSSTTAQTSTSTTQKKTKQPISTGTSATTKRFPTRATKRFTTATTTTTMGPTSSSTTATNIAKMSSKITPTTTTTLNTNNDKDVAASSSATTVPSTSSEVNNPPLSTSKTSLTTPLSSATPAFRKADSSDSKKTADDEFSKDEYENKSDENKRTTISSDYIDIDDSNDVNSNFFFPRNSSSGGNDSQTPFTDFDYDNKKEHNGATFSSSEEDDVIDGLIADTGAVRDSASPAGTIALIPIIIGIVASVVVGLVVIAIMVWIWVRNQRQKQKKSHEDQMTIITEYVETNLNN